MRQTEPRQRIALLSIVGVIAGVVLAAAPGCTGVTNTTAVQCSSEAECLSLGPDFAGSTCDPNTRTCIKPQSNVGLCTHNQECLDQAGGAPAICRKTDKKCVTLTTPECPFVFTKPGNSDLANDNVVIIGSLEPGPNIELGIVFERAVELGWYEVSTNEFRGLPPVPGTTDPRPFAVVDCREFGAGREGLFRAANHLAKDVQVPLVIGPIDPTDIAPVASQIFMPAHILSILPVAISTNLVNLPGNPIAPTPLLWRLFYDDKAMGRLTAEFVKNQLEPLVLAQSAKYTPPPPPIKVALIASGDLIGQSEKTQIEAALRFNGKSASENQADGNYLPLNIGDFDDPVGNPNPDAKVGQALGALFGYKPQIIIHSYTPTAISKVYFPIEGGWPDVAAPRPYHIGMTPVFNGFGPLFPFLSAQPFRNGRMWSVQNYTNPNGQSSPYPLTSPQVQSWLTRFNDRNPEFVASVSPKSQNTWANYDAVYLAAYAIAALKDKPITGDNLAQLLGQFNPPGVQINTFDGPTGDMSKAFSELAAGRNIELQGLFGHMHFDTGTAAPTYGLEITCPSTAPTGATTGMKGSGFHVKVETQTAVITSPDGAMDNPPTGTMNGCPPPPP